MKHIYKVSGMTCSGCQTAIEEALGEIKGVSEVEVNLEKGKVSLNMDGHYSIEDLQNSLPSKYILSKQAERNVFKSVEPKKEKSDLQQLFPLFLIFLYITLDLFYLI